MKNYKFAIIANKYESSQQLYKVLNAKLLAFKLQENLLKPEIIFVIGGDGTFLKAVNQYNHLLETVQFVSFKCGNLGFYENFMDKQVDEVLQWIAQDKLKINPLSLLEIAVNNKLFYAINEVKFINNISTLKCQILINNQQFENFRGTGVLLSTRTGSTGLMKALGGAVILANVPLMQFNEIAAVAHNSYRSLNSPIIFDQNQVVTLQSSVENEKLSSFGQLVIDTFVFSDKVFSKVTIKLSSLTLKVLEYAPNHHSLISKVQKAFIQD